VTSNADLATWLNIGPASILCACWPATTTWRTLIAVVSAVAAVVATVAAARLRQRPIAEP